MLTTVLTYHVVAGKYSAADLMAKAKAMGGSVTLQTVEGAPITIKEQGGSLWVFDQAGNAAKITIADVPEPPWNPEITPEVVATYCLPSIS